MDADLLPVYVHIPKTGGTSMCTALMFRYQGSTRFSVMGLRGENALKAKKFQGLSARRLARLQIAFGHQTQDFHLRPERPITYFATIRHPFDRVKSSYRQDRKYRKMNQLPDVSIEAFIEQNPKRLWHYFFTKEEVEALQQAGHDEGQIKAIAWERIDRHYAAIGLMEDLDRSICLYNHLLGLDIHEIQHLNKSAATQVASNDRDAAHLAGLMAEDVAFYEELVARFESQWAAFEGREEALAKFRERKAQWNEREAHLARRIPGYTRFRKIAFEVKRKLY